MPGTTIAPTARHGKARACLLIDGQVYHLKRRKIGHWELRPWGGPRDGATYCTGRTKEGEYCTCPDRLYRGTRCKHLGALYAVGLLARLRRKGVAGA